MNNHELALQIDAIYKIYSNDVGFIPFSTLENRYIAKGRYIVYLEDDQVIGYILHGSMKKDKPVSLTQIVVKPGHHVGIQLFRSFLVRAKEHGCSGIKVRCADTLKAKWSSLGFTLVKTLDTENARKRKINVWYKVI